MTRLVENLLSLARADGGAEAISFAPVSLELLLRRTGERWATPAQDASLTFNIEIPNGDLLVLCDESNILRLLSILAENAVKYTLPGGKITLFSTVRPERISISVKDTGIGIPEKDRSRIFERFFRGNPEQLSPTAGSGLGLALAKWIADCHGTVLEADSEPGKGSCFSFSLERTGVHTYPAAEGNPSVHQPSNFSTVNS
jgi:signal transduction histidine kinase